MKLGMSYPTQYDAKSLSIQRQSYHPIKTLASQYDEGYHHHTYQDAYQEHHHESIFRQPDHYSQPPHDHQHPVSSLPKHDVYSLHKRSEIMEHNVALGLEMAEVCQPALIALVWLTVAYAAWFAISPSKVLRQNRLFTGKGAL